MFRTNPNAFLLMDQDLDFTKAADGTLTAKDPTSTKARIFTEFNDPSYPKCQAIATGKYTGADQDHASQAVIADAFVEKNIAFNSAHDEEDLPVLMKVLHDTIRSWHD